MVASPAIACVAPGTRSYLGLGSWSAQGECRPVAPAGAHLRFQRSTTSCQLGTQGAQRIDRDEDGAVKDEEREREEVPVVLNAHVKDVANPSAHGRKPPCTHNL